MALVTCGKCGREISDRAPHCIGCGAPVAATANITALPTAVRLQPNSTFIGTKALLVKLAAKAVLQIGWKLDSADEQAGMIGFSNGITWGSWSGISGTIYMEDLRLPAHRVRQAERAWWAAHRAQHRQ
ncbi:zinc-ribbon domain-containing protein [Mesorhizobium sp. M2C.T.Ca.TU.002.02.1.1]|jgi:hypothetical protein|uniref:zinc-ribbon domain-containing protein n=1 Tax=Mesorhizobium sp. M2C.T.Ca.TU.002.02.1.1 TaxID=2496788 RepID=UPI000FCA272A|nr:zinc-ribbon domain-containing protein [Mesorhizobium sp. M2C.T.Ca.TU.002.02.1.1]RUU60972.1 zinc ribbon domain-containing protein [Mesorhizobium sp. M2C.T.Ca.TU.002.02.1.1]RUU72039.1 zinc ribbon domain-containing protein [Mesorhizobium sp. M2C.T.Ca.TU.009.01.2.1]